MRQQVQTAIRIIYPPRCVSCGDRVAGDFALCGPCWRETPFIGDSVCDLCGAPQLSSAPAEALICDACQAMPRPWRQGRAALLYQGNARRLILALKHGDRTELARPMSRWLFEAAQPLFRPDLIVAPVPLHWRRLLKRRYNQSALLAAGLAKMMHVELCPDLLQRTKATPSLEGISREARFQTLRDVIQVHPRHVDRIKNRSILLIDDVMTTGATLDAASRACKMSQANDVCVIALARVVKHI
ncbi:ComF family protein [Cognatishimia sp. SS12]|uniref:ComF family protein n=1 Tax=Cognatishimia sp. SS12 TaxID=2979465 RepID=UPI00232E074B|nr:ComF family protein [Cognatishimia sp. SS12]MDC0737706.1 ComF family protein [Cognatishimia sp. SS12]